MGSFVKSEDADIHKELEQKLPEVKKINDQLAKFLDIMTLNEDEKERRYAILESLKELLLERLPGHGLYAFGSILTGIGHKNSTIDIWVGENLRDMSLERMERFWINRKGFVTKIISLLHDDPSRYGWRSVERKFTDATVILESPNSTRPKYVRTVHLETGINCDMFPFSYFAYQNSKLVGLLTKLDPRVRPLISIILHWAKFHGLIEFPKIKGYAFILLVVIFLTRRRILPTIYKLKNWDEELYEEGDDSNEDPKKFPVDEPCHEFQEWTATFIQNDFIVRKYLERLEKNGTKPAPIYQTHSNIGNAKSKQDGNTTSKIDRLPTCRSILELMMDFCSMYRKFDRSSYVICALTSEFIPRVNFQENREHILPDELQEYKNYCSANLPNHNILDVSPRRHFVLQDPFMLNVNLTKLTPLIVLQRFEELCFTTEHTLKAILSLPEQEFESFSLMDIFKPS